MRELSQITFAFKVLEIIRLKVFYNDFKKI